MWYEFFWLLFCLLLFQPRLVAVILRCKPDLFFKQSAEGADAFKAYFIAYFRHGPVLGEQVLGLVEPFLREVFVRRFAINACKKPVKMKPRQECPRRNIFQPDGFLEIFIDEDLRSSYPLVHIGGEAHCTKGTSF